MRTYIKHIVIAGAALLASGTITAQNLNSAYFLEGFAQGHEMNPAKEYDRKGYVSMPLLMGYMNLGTKGNLNLKDVLYKNPNGSGLVTYLHPSIDSDKALSAFSSRNKLIMDTRYDLVSVGFHAFKGYNTISLGLRVNAGVNIPYELFEVTKKLTNKDYNISSAGATARSWVELALGHSHQINEAWRIGGKLKFLVGAGYANVKLSGVDLNLSDENQWTATANATAEVGVKNFTWGKTETKEYKSRPGTYEQIDFGNIDVDKFGPNGFGAGLDLGVEWDLGKQGWVDGLKVSAALLDLSFIKWKNVATAQNRGETFVFNGFNNIRVQGDPAGVKMGDQTDDLADRLSDLYSLQPGEYTSKATWLGATLNIGVEYALPAYDRLKFGLLSTTRMQGTYTWNEQRMAVTVSPIKWLEVSGNVGLGTCGANLGWIINIHPRGFSLFLGSDHCLGKFTKQGIPMRSSYDFAMGISFPFGKSRIGKEQVWREHIQRPME